MVVCIFLMAALAVGFFAPGFASLSRIVQPNHAQPGRRLRLRPSRFLLGGGLLPLALGYLGQAASFSLGITITGAVILVGSAATLFCGCSPTSTRAAEPSREKEQSMASLPADQAKAEALARFQAPAPEHINCGQAVLVYALLRLDEDPDSITRGQVLRRRHRRHGRDLRGAERDRPGAGRARPGPRRPGCRDSPRPTRPTSSEPSSATSPRSSAPAAAAISPATT